VVALVERVLTLSTYGHLFAAYEDAERIDAEQEIVTARGASSQRCAHSVHNVA
jgi:hypothetical protein